MDPTELSPQELLRHTGWMRNLARSILRDPGAADDAVQESWLAFLRRPPEDPRALSSWLRRVLVNFAGRRRRDDLSRLTRDRAAARPELAESTAEDVLLRAELHRRVVELVLALDEPLRATVLYRFFEEKSPAEIARLQGIPATTVRSRIERALEHLRSRLDAAHCGRRGGWRACMAALAGLSAAASARAASASAASASTSIPAPAGVKVAQGVLCMTSKKLGVSLVVSAILVLGLLGILSLRSGRQESPGAPPATGAREAAAAAGGGAARTALDRTRAVKHQPEGAALAGAPRDERPISIQGRVLDFEGQGIAVARVAAIEALGWQEPLLGVERYTNPIACILGLRREYDEIVGGSPTVMTDSAGSYAFRGLAPGDYRMTAAHAEHRPGPEARAAVVAGATAVCDLELAPSHSISGRVLDENGRPVEGALVSSEEVLAAASRGMGRVLEKLGQYADGVVLLPPPESRSAADGSFRLAGLAPAPQRLEARKEGWVPGVAGANPGDGDVVLVLRRGASLSGRILDARGSPAAHAVVELESPSPSFDSEPKVDGFDLRPGRKCSTRTDPHGKFLLAGIEEGRLELTVRVRGFPLLAHTLEVGREPVDLGDLTLAETFGLSGTVLAPGGLPAGGATVRASPEGKDDGRISAVRPADPPTESRCDAEGKFAFTGFPAGRYRLVARAGGAEAAAAAEAGAQDLALQLQEAAAVSGFCLDGGDRRPIAGAVVRLEGTEASAAATGADGGFTCAVHPRPWAKELRVRASHAEYDEALAPVRIGSKDPVELLLKPSPGVGGSVVDSQGNPVSGARVQLEISGFPRAFLAAMSGFKAVFSPHYSRGDGTFFVPVDARLQSAPGLEIVARHPVHGAGRIACPGPKAGAAQAGVELVLSHGPPILGRIVDIAGAPVAGAQVSALRQATSSPPSSVKELLPLLSRPRAEVAYSNRTGGYRIRSLEPGRYQLEATAPGFAASNVESVVIGSQPVELDITLDMGGSVAGRTVDATGAPVPRAQIFAFPLDRTPADMLQLNALGDSVLALAKSDDQGRFDLPHLPAVPLAIVARAAGFEPALAENTAGASLPAVLVLVPYGRLLGSAADAASGAPVENFRVQLEIDAGEKSGIKRFSAHKSAVLTVEDAGGSFLIEDLPAGEYHLTVVSEEHLTFNGTARVEPGKQAAFHARLERGLRLAGVTRAAGTAQPVAGAKVVLARLETSAENGPPSRRPIRGRSVIASKKGEFVFKGLEAGDYQVTVEHAGFYLDAEHGAVRVSVTESDPLPLELGLLPAGRIQGRLRCHGGAGPAVEHYEVEARSLEPEDENTPSPVTLVNEGRSSGRNAAPPVDTGMPGLAARARVQPDGRYSLNGLRPGAYRLEVLKYARDGSGNVTRTSIEAGTIELGPAQARSMDLEAP